MTGSVGAISRVIIGFSTNLSYTSEMLFSLLPPLIIGGACATILKVLFSAVGWMLAIDGDPIVRASIDRAFDRLTSTTFRVFLDSVLTRLASILDGVLSALWVVAGVLVALAMGTQLAGSALAVAIVGKTGVLAYLDAMGASMAGTLPSAILCLISIYLAKEALFKYRCFETGPIELLDMPKPIRRRSAVIKISISFGCALSAVLAAFLLAPLTIWPALDRVVDQSHVGILSTFFAGYLFGGPFLLFVAVMAFVFTVVVLLFLLAPITWFTVRYAPRVCARMLLLMSVGTAPIFSQLGTFAGGLSVLIGALVSIVRALNM